MYAVGEALLHQHTFRRHLPRLPSTVVLHSLVLPSRIGRSPGCAAENDKRLGSNTALTRSRAVRWPPLVELVFAAHQ
jgi:hypothetical protein